MHYCCTYISGSVATKSPDKVAREATAHMQSMAAQGWRLVSTSSTGPNFGIYLFWQWG